jgi:hypothetical protein
MFPLLLIKQNAINRSDHDARATDLPQTTSFTAVAPPPYCYLTPPTAVL